MKHKILLIEDEKKLLRILKLVLEENGYKVKTAEDGGQGIDIWTQWKPCVVMTDLQMQPVGGMEVLKFGRLNFPEVPLIILTAFGSIKTAVTAMKNGAFDFLSKPVDHKQLLEIIEHALVVKKKDPKSLEDLIGSSNVMELIKKNILLFASTNSSVLINGESGTGKEIAARAIHQAGERQKGPFVKVNCAAIPRELIESELFGHKKGAFTGALQDRKGAFRQADHGVLFLDEIGDLPIELQAKLLHAVEEKTITPVGASSPIPVSVKILSATNLNLESMIAASKFRADLYYRLNTVSLHMPALRDKPADICELSFFFIKKFCQEFDKPVLKITDNAMRVLEKYSWPGNVRQLKNVIERAVITCSQDTITCDHLPENIKHIKPEQQLISRNMDENIFDMAAQEQNLMMCALEQCGWNQSSAAKVLGITRSALRYRLQKYGIAK
ncbi:MAG: sigma-54 dependent transcriptional regulator [Proteobacteria bacterium]|nr:sigma-54 dependent transcriptional regulator [Pseudomonadota bacterium]MBU1388841.1 sigma-54 dependent transcriptional regulator [Pseudomonadota bacterium]MBU1542222.1 sigma-54 dependent transcriptional regulator [Pseudomonadota bacterium]MBU2429862.1 sigma-54 dependent transcriptional regulator [Pseudomonadota bacterium]MBU2480412.1 sigma-54 dependent transcriptional regulator [Pseudomonadota bacterium]